MEFVCHVGTADGRVEKFSRSARDERALRDELEREGMHVFGVERSVPLPSLGNLLAGLGFQRRRKIPLKTLLLFSQELAALLKAGLPLLQGLNLMLERMKDPTFREVLLEVRDQVKSGVELSDAFAAFGDTLPAAVRLDAQGRREDRRARTGDPPLHPLPQAGARGAQAGLSRRSSIRRSWSACRSRCCS